MLDWGRQSAAGEGPGLECDWRAPASWYPLALTPLAEADLGQLLPPTQIPSHGHSSPWI